MCPNVNCPSPNLQSEQLLQSAKDTPIEDPETKLYKRHLVWECPACGFVIYPTLKIRVGSNPERIIEQVPLFHSVQMRNLVEIYLQVDVNYRSVQ